MNSQGNRDSLSSTEKDRDQRETKDFEECEDEKEFVNTQNSSIGITSKNENHLESPFFGGESEISTVFISSKISRFETRRFFDESSYISLKNIPTKGTKYFFDPKTEDYNPKKLSERVLNINFEEFLHYLVYDDTFIRKFHENRKDLNLKMSPWKRINNEWYEKTSDFLMNLKLPFSAKTHQPIIDRMRLTLLKGSRKLLWEHCFQPSGFYGSDCIFLLGQIVVTQIADRKTKVVIGAAPVYVKNLNILIKWKVTSVSMGILTECFKVIDGQFIHAEREILEMEEFDKQRIRDIEGKKRDKSSKDIEEEKKELMKKKKEEEEKLRRKEIEKKISWRK